MSTNDILSAMSHSSKGYWEPTGRAADSPASFMISSETPTFTLCAHKSLAVCSMHFEWQQKKNNRAGKKCWHYVLK